jgi:ribosomal protein S18 acetylase RimI-like enzyme
VITVRIADVASEPLRQAVERLLAQLGAASPALTTDRLTAILTWPGVALWCAHDGDVSARVVGMLTLAWYPLPSGLHVRIEDVVVDHTERGRGVGAALVRAALDHARALGATRVDLTSSPERASAIRLYERLGFRRRSTNAFRCELTP